MRTGCTIPGRDECSQPRRRRLGVQELKQAGWSLGRVRFYRQDDDSQLEFVGENEIDHTPKDETLRVYTGNAFDLVGERRRTDFAVENNAGWLDEAFEIKVRNHKDEPVEIRIVEHLYRRYGWEITQKSQDFTKMDARTIEFRVKLAPDAEEKITYTVHYTW